MVRKMAVLFALTTLAPVAVLLWLGFRLVEQDRSLESQQIQQRIDRAADGVVGALQRAVEDSDRRLDDDAAPGPEGAVVIVIRNGSIEARPKDRLAYYPVVPPLREASGRVFAPAEEIEFKRGDHLLAIGQYRDLAKSPDPAVSAGAQVRLARNLRSLGRVEAAREAYRQLANTDNVAIDGVPASLVALSARRQLGEDTGQEIERGLDTGRWMLTEPVYQLYAREIRHNGQQHELLAAAAEMLWQKSNTMPSSGRQSLTVNGQLLTVIWHASPDAFRALIATPAFVEQHWMGAHQGITVRIGSSAANMRPRAIRWAAETSLPWDVVFSSAAPGVEHSAFVLRTRLLLTGFVVLVTMTLAAGYVMVRAINRELAAARLQAHFLAAVSHEFRTPLTSLRQFTDRLLENRSLGEDARRVCHEAQSRATDRLTGLVESLLDLGRMEAGARPYRFEACDCEELVKKVVDDFRGDACSSGFEIALHGNGGASISGDREALSRAVWNLLDNAVKYSPEERRMDVAVAHVNGDVSISVRDYGIGIPANEQASVFMRFRRGEEARQRGIKGTGIGLAMVDHIVKAHRGRIDLASEPGKGSTFTIVLPAKK